MIRSVDIRSFGCFSGFVWKDHLRDKGNNVLQFKKLNVIYGRNYSGKTTLSRIVRSLETGTLPDKIENASFEVKTDEGSLNNISIPSPLHHLRVYNSDFVRDHLSFLRDSTGNITPFAIIGGENKETQAEIDELERRLGSVDSKSGLRSEQATAAAEFHSEEDAWGKAERELKTKLTEKATKRPSGIKHNAVYGDANYNTPKIEADIDTIVQESFEPVDDETKAILRLSLAETALPSTPRMVFKAKLTGFMTSAKALVTKTIAPTKPIQELLNDAVLQAWVKEGIPHHRGKRETCGFCGQTLPPDLWTRLDAHFSKESAVLETSIDELTNDILQHNEEVGRTLQLIGADDFYSTLRGQFTERETVLRQVVKTYSAALDQIRSVLSARKADIFNYQSFPEIVDNTNDVVGAVESMNSLAVENDEKTLTLDRDQEEAKRTLRLSEVARFVDDIGYEKELESIAELKEKARQTERQLSNFSSEILEIENRADRLRSSLRDEKKGADRINVLLTNYFGHEGLRLEASQDEGDAAYKFRIMRGDSLAYDLSEGECSLVAFCYFVARLEDSEAQGKNLIIFIDDPVSSLDSNHVFFVYSLIESAIAKAIEDERGERILDANGKATYRYEQLFVSTHNLEFLKYLKRLSKPKNESEHFIIVRDKLESIIRPMPKYLRNYITEFNFLFSEIYNCVDPANADGEHSSFYSFGNNLRKFLEAYLFFKFPFASNDDRDEERRLHLFFKEDEYAKPLIARITNEYSHLSGGLERSAEPIDHAEISRTAQYVLGKVKQSDPEQYRSLLESIGKPDPLGA